MIRPAVEDNTDPRMMLTLLIFNSATGTRSSRKIRARCEQDLACRVIVGEDTPDCLWKRLTGTRSAVPPSSRRHVAAFEKLFVEVLRLASASGLLKLGRLALDGTQIKAFSEIASRHKALSYGRMQTEEARLPPEIRELLAQAESEDQADDAQHGERTVAAMNCPTNSRSLPVHSTSSLGR